MLYQNILEKIQNIWLNGSFENRVTNNLNIGIENIDANHVMMQMKEVAISTGSACASISSQESHVLKAIGLSKNKIHSSIRFGIGRFNTEEEINYVTNKLSEVGKKIKNNFKN